MYREREREGAGVDVISSTGNEGDKRKRGGDITQLHSSFSPSHNTFTKKVHTSKKKKERTFHDAVDGVTIHTHSKPN